MSRTTLQVPFKMDDSSKMIDNHNLPPSFEFPPLNSNMNQNSLSQNQSMYPQVCGSNFKFNMGTQHTLQSNIQSNNHIPLQSHLKRSKNDPLFQANIKTGHKLVNLQSENSYDFVAKNFPFLQESEIKHIITEDDISNSVENSTEKPKRISFEKQQQVDRQLNQLKIKNVVKPFMDEQQKKLGIQNNQIIQNSQGRPSKKRGKRAIDQEFQELQPKEKASTDKEMNSQGQQSQESCQQPSQQPGTQIQEQVQNSPNQIEQQQNSLQLQDTPNDKFFDTLESNLQQFMHDRHAAYAFISNQLKQFKDESSAVEQKDLQDKLQYHQWATDILKKGVKIQNKKLNENDAKAKCFDELLTNYKTVEQKNIEMEKQLNQLKTLNEFLLRNQIGDPHCHGFNDGSFDGFGGGVC